MKTAVLASGGGTNLQSLIDTQQRGALAPADLVVVGANVTGCFALERARKAGITTFVLSHKAFASREDFDLALVAELRKHGVELVVLAGFMRVLTPVFLGAFPHRVINIHPTLLPAFPGIHGQKQALDYGVKLAGCTVHFVDTGTDTGPIIAQAAVPVLPGDDENSLGQRILSEEHKLLPAVVRAVAAGQVVVAGRHVEVRLEVKSEAGSKSASEAASSARLAEARLRTIDPV